MSGRSEGSSAAGTGERALDLPCVGGTDLVKRQHLAIGQAGERAQRLEAVRHGRYVTFQMAEVAVSRQMFRQILSLIARLRAAPAPARPRQWSLREANSGRRAPL